MTPIERFFELVRQWGQRSALLVDGAGVSAEGLFSEALKKSDQKRGYYHGQDVVKCYSSVVEVAHAIEDNRADVIEYMQEVARTHGPHFSIEDVWHYETYLRRVIGIPNADFDRHITKALRECFKYLQRKEMRKCS